MKKLIIILLIAFASCKKETSNNSNNLFTETKDNVKINEPVLLSFGDNSSAETVTWKCEPSTGVTSSIVGDFATYTFATAGSYTITATSSTQKKATYMVNVINTLYDEFGGSFGLGTSKLLKVGVNENVVFTAHNPATAVKSTDWAVHSIPSTLIGFNSDNTQITVSFQTTGAKFVSLTNGGKTEIKSVWVEDSASSASTNIPFLLGDKLNITPSVLADSSGNKTLIFTTASSYKYFCSNDYILCGQLIKNKTYTLSYNGINTNANACNNIVAPKGIQSLSNMLPGNDYTFNIIYQNKLFTGSIVVSQNNVFTITFTDNNLVNISPKIVQ